MRAPNKSALLGGPPQLFFSFCECVSQQSWKTQLGLHESERRRFSTSRRRVRYMYEMPRAIVIKILLARPLVLVAYTLYTYVHMQDPVIYNLFPRGARNFQLC